jgi:hypothetical protein
MADILIDYELLYRLAAQMYALRDRLDRTRQADHSFLPSDIGPRRQTAEALSDYYGAWNSAFKRALDVMTELASTFESVGKAWYDQDSSFASGLNQQAAQSQRQDWESKQQAYQRWQELSQQSVTLQYYDEHGKLRESHIPLADPKKPPEAPGPPPNHYETTRPDGSVLTTDFDYEGDHLVQTSTTIKNADGLTYHESTTFTANDGYSTVIDHPDGTNTRIEVVAQPDGSATRTVTNGDDVKQWTGNVRTDTWQEA